MVSQGDEEESARQEDNNDYAHGCSREEFEMKMALTEKPVPDAPKDRASAGLWTHRYRGVDRRIYHKCVFLPRDCSPLPSGAIPSKQSQYQILTRYKPSAGATNRVPSRRPDFNRELISSGPVLCNATRVIAPTINRTIL